MNSTTTTKAGERTQQIVYAGKGIYQLRTWNAKSEHYDEMALDSEIFKSIYGCEPMHAHLYHPSKFSTPYDIDNAYAKERLATSINRKTGQTTNV